MRLTHSAVLAAVALAAPAVAQAPEAAPAAPSYADLAELVIGSPVIVDATVRSAARINGAEAAGTTPGATRFYVTADVGALIRSPGAMPPSLGWLYDARPAANGRAPKLKRLRVLAFARPVAGAAGQVQLVARGAHFAWTPALDAEVRRIATEAVSPDAPPAVTGIGNAFHVPGTLPGEGETQIFLQTASGRPVSLSVIRRPGEQPRFAVALSEIVDDAAAAPARGTLLWYRLACGLPRALPERSLASLEPADAERARADYAFVLERLGACGRTGLIG